MKSDDSEETPIFMGDGITSSGRSRLYPGFAHEADSNSLQRHHTPRTHQGICGGVWIELFIRLLYSACGDGPRDHR